MGTQDRQITFGHKKEADAKDLSGCLITSHLFLRIFKALGVQTKTASFGIIYILILVITKLGSAGEIDARCW